MQDKPVILITGCSSGFGLEIARYFIGRKWMVIATMRTPREDAARSIAASAKTTNNTPASASSRSRAPAICHAPFATRAAAPAVIIFPFETVKKMIDRLIEVEGIPEVLQLSGGEPLIHPEFARILEYACSTGIELIMVNTNGMKLAQNDELVALLAKFEKRVEVYLQFDGFEERTQLALRGVSIVDQKLRTCRTPRRRGCPRHL